MRCQNLAGLIRKGRGRGTKNLISIKKRELTIKKIQERSIFG